MLESIPKFAAADVREGLRVRRLILSCRKLLTERGEAAGVSLAQVTLDLYRELDKREQARCYSDCLRSFCKVPESA
jgi:hypothetical protein